MACSQCFSICSCDDYGSYFNLFGLGSRKILLTKDVSFDCWAKLGFAVCPYLLFQKHEFGKDAKLGAIGYLTIVLFLIGMHFFSENQNVFYLKQKASVNYGFLIGSILVVLSVQGFIPF